MLLEKMKYFSTVNFNIDIFVNRDIEVEERIYLNVRNRNIEYGICHERIVWFSMKM